jgi:hypothetical protein
VTIGAGGMVTWTHAGTKQHTVSDAATAPLDSMTINGRAFVGNTPIIVANSGERIRWYVFNLDLGERWHNFHPHGQRFEFAGDTVDTRSIGPAESFCVDTTVPPVILDLGNVPMGTTTVMATTTATGTATTTMAALWGTASTRTTTTAMAGGATACAVTSWSTATLRCT